MEHILYVLPMLHKEGFKVGITSTQDLSRIKHLNALYGFDLNQSFLVRSSERIIKTLERQLLTDYATYRYDVGEGDGHTEFLSKECFSSVLDDIRHKERLRHIQMSIEQGVNLCDIKEKGEKPARPTRTKKIKGQWTYDFSALDAFMELVRANKDVILVRVREEANDGIVGKKLTLYVWDIDVCKAMYKHCLIEYGYNSENFFVFIDGSVYSKKTGLGYTILAGLYDHFEQEARFTDRVVFNRLHEAFNEIINTLTHLTNGKQNI